MFQRMGKKLAEGAKKELEFDPDRILNLVELGIGLLSLALMSFGSLKCSKPAQPMTIVINNIIQK